MTTVSLYPYLILVGASIIAATGWLLYRARAQTKLAQELVRLNEELQFDLPDFLKQCWPALESGGFEGLSWRLEWFGASISGEQGSVTEGVLYQHFEVQEINLDIRLYHRKRGWEQRYFSQVMADNFFLLVRMDIWIKLGTIRGTFDQTAKMTVFLQHDMKNLMQLVSLAAGQLENQMPGQEKKLLLSLQKSIPAVRDRAQHMLNALTNSQSRGKSISIDVVEMLQETATMLELPINVNGGAMATISEESLHSIFENLLGNYASLRTRNEDQTQDLQILVRQDSETIVIEMEDRNGQPFLSPERLFEPFWSERGQGRGIGLYQSRQLAQTEGGNLEAVAHRDSPLRFVLTLPANL
ncbi:MAG: ATP-binding protein [Gammaproteobacteria bacterium]